MKNCDRQSKSRKGKMFDKREERKGREHKKGMREGIESGEGVLESNRGGGGLQSVPS